MTRIRARLPWVAVAAAVAAVSMSSVRPEPPKTVVDGFAVGFVPAGIRADGAPGHAVYAVEENRLRNDGAGPGPREPAATVSMLRYESVPGEASRMWITVLRPVPAGAEVGAAQITRWLVGSQTAGTTPVDSYPVPAGQAQLIKHVGSEITAYTMVITAADGAVLVIEAPGTFPLGDLKRVAGEMRPA